MKALINWDGIKQKTAFEHTSEKIRIVHWHNEHGEENSLSNIILGNTYTVIKPAPKGYYSGGGEKWVLGIGRPVRILKHEYVPEYFGEEQIKKHLNKYPCPYCNSDE